MSILEWFGFLIFWFVFVRIMVVQFIIPLIKYVYILYGPNNAINRHLKPKTDQNSWAIVTGGTNGIGLEYSRQLLEYGYCLLIISRDELTLQRVKEDLIKNNPSLNLIDKIRIFKLDFSKPFQSNQYDQLEELIKQLPSIEVLVNNVGISFDTADFFTNIISKNPDLHRSMINVNIGAILHMTRICLPLMMMKQNFGIIINIRLVKNVFFKLILNDHFGKLSAQ